MSLWRSSGRGSSCRDLEEPLDEEKGWMSQSANSADLDEGSPSRRIEPREGRRAHSRALAPVKK